MHAAPHIKLGCLFSSLLTITLSACSLLSVERIVDQRPDDPGASMGQATFSAFEARLGQQAELLQVMATQVSSLSTENAVQGTRIAYLATRGPAPATVVVDRSQTPSDLIIGSVEIEQGKCCVGGTAGEQLELLVEFNAIGLQAPVTEMRYRNGGYANLIQDPNEEDWVAYTSVLYFTYRIPINWTGYHVQVQFRDSLGNLSQIYSDDISVEGMPAYTPSP